MKSKIIMEIPSNYIKFMDIYMSSQTNKNRAPRNRTISLSARDRMRLEGQLRRLTGPTEQSEILNSTINQDLFEILDYLPVASFDLIFLDPPYNLTKSFNGRTFNGRSTEEYAQWMETWFPKLLRTLKKTGSIYICGDWRSAAAIQLVIERYAKLRNRITWEREKGRAANTNWKNCSEDIWFCTLSDDYTFNIEAVRLKRRVIAPYTHSNGDPKDWIKSEGGGFRLTAPSNLWTDLTVPFWSMPENTDHPTQKPEKLLAKIILASTKEQDIVFDPFLGSGTTSVVAKKLNRKYVGVEIDTAFCCLAEKRLEMANSDKTIQGFTDGVFWERNSLAQQNKEEKNKGSASQPKLQLCQGRNKHLK